MPQVILEDELRPPALEGARLVGATDLDWLLDLCLSLPPRCCRAIGELTFLEGTDEAYRTLPTQEIRPLARVEVALDTLEPMDPSPQPASPFPASTLLLLREPAGQIEVLMVKRSSRSSFMGGVYVYPGGGVDPLDAATSMSDRIRGLSDEEASARLGLERGGLAFWIAAVRELFEESGMLLATWADGSPISLAEEHAERFASHRAGINRGELSVAEMLALEDLVVDLSSVLTHAHWVTPTCEPKRFDTWFFVARAPAEQEPLHDAGETVVAEWTSPAEALRRHRAGEIEMVLPTLRGLGWIDRYASIDELLDAARRIGPLVTVTPRLVMLEEGPILLVPGDEGFDDEAALPTLSDSSLFKEAARRRARRENPPDA